jgi:hypothetical protein
MKKLLLTALLTTVASFGFAQGTVNFSLNSIPAAERGPHLINDNSGAPLIGTQYRAELWYGEGAGLEATSLTAVPGQGTYLFRAAGTSSPGTWSSGGSVTLPGVEANETATLQVRVWDTSLAGTYAEAIGLGQWGASSTWDYTVPAPGSPPAAFFITGLEGYNLEIIPEPSVIALALAGGLGFLFLRRRK